MVLVQNKYKNTLVGVLRTQIAFVTHSSPSCYVTLRTQVIRLNSGNLGPQKTDSGVFIIIYSMSLFKIHFSGYVDCIGFTDTSYLFQILLFKLNVITGYF